MRKNLLSHYQTEDFFRQRSLIYLKTIDQFCPITNLRKIMPDHSFNLADSKKFMTAFESLATEQFGSLDKILFENAIDYSFL